MPENAEQFKGLLVDKSEAFVDLTKIPDKPTLFQKLFGSPSRVICSIGILVTLIAWVLLDKYYSPHSTAPKPSQTSSWLTPAVAPPLDMTLKRGVWGPKVQVEGKSFRELSVVPMVRRAYLVTRFDNSQTIHHSPATLANNVHLGNDMKSFRVMVEPDESHPEAKLEYSLK